MIFNRNLIISPDKKNFWFLIFITYQTLAFFYVPFSASIDRFSFSYFSLVIPPWIFILANYKNLISGYKPASLSLAIFGVTVGILGALKGDFSLSYNAIFISTLAVVILNSELRLRVIDLNKIFGLVIFGGIILQLLHMTEYKIFPKVPNISCLDIVDWRVSLFRVPTEGAILSFIAVIINLQYIKSIKNWLRMLIVFVGLYFLIFSAIRGVVFPAFFILSIYLALLFKKTTIIQRNFLMAWLGVALIVIICIPYTLGAQTGFWKNYIFRETTCENKIINSKPINSNSKINHSETVSSEISKDWILATMNRQCTIAYHVDLFSKAPMGSIDIAPQSEKSLPSSFCSNQSIRTYCSSCVFITYWMARAGIFAIPLILGLFLLLKETLLRKSVDVFLIVSFFVMVSFFWGGVFVPYNFIFILFLSFPAFVFTKK
jgi:hypothetical protein